MGSRPDVPDDLAGRFRTIAATLPRCHEEDAWVGVRWRVGKSTVAHVFGGEDGLFRVTLRGDPDEVVAFQHLGLPYFKAGWGSNVIGLVLDDTTDWDEVAELVTASYCLLAPKRLADEVASRWATTDDQLDRWPVGSSQVRDRTSRIHPAGSAQAPPGDSMNGTNQLGPV